MVELQFWDHEHYKTTGEPTKCRACGSSEFRHKTTDSLDGMVLEFDVHCSACGHLVGAWAHGYYDPCFGNLRTDGGGP